MEQFKGEIILMGDFNITLEDRAFVWTFRVTRNRGRLELQEIIDTFNIGAGFRMVYSEGCETSFKFPGKDRTISLDRIYKHKDREIKTHK